MPRSYDFGWGQIPQMIGQGLQLGMMMRQQEQAAGKADQETSFNLMGKGITLMGTKNPELQNMGLKIFLQAAEKGSKFLGLGSEDLASFKNIQFRDEYTGYIKEFGDLHKKLQKGDITPDEFKIGAFGTLQRFSKDFHPEWGTKLAGELATSAKETQAAERSVKALQEYTQAKPTGGLLDLRNIPETELGLAQLGAMDPYATGKVTPSYEQSLAMAQGPKAISEPFQAMVKEALVPPKPKEPELEQKYNFLTKSLKYSPEDARKVLKIDPTNTWNSEIMKLQEDIPKAITLYGEASEQVKNLRKDISNKINKEKEKYALQGVTPKNQPVSYNKDDGKLYVPSVTGMQEYAGPIIPTREKDPTKTTYDKQRESAIKVLVEEGNKNPTEVDIVKKQVELFKQMNPLIELLTQITGGTSDNPLGIKK